jgi:valyl-tRNA synthetase
MTKPFLTGKVGTKEVRENKQKLLVVILSTCLRLLHPMAPFITEELFSLLQKKFSFSITEGCDPYTRECLEAFQAKTCMQAQYPQVVRKEDRQEKIEETFAFLDEVIHAIRNVRAEMQIPPQIATDLLIIGEDKDPNAELLLRHQTIVTSLVKVSSLNRLQGLEPAFSAKKRVLSIQIVIPLPQELKEKEKLRLEKDKQKLQAQLASLETKLSQEEFLTKAPKEILDKMQSQHKQMQAQLQDILDKL